MHRYTYANFEKDALFMYIDKYLPAEPPRLAELNSKNAFSSQVRRSAEVRSRGRRVAPSASLCEQWLRLHGGLLPGAPLREHKSCVCFPPASCEKSDDDARRRNLADEARKVRLRVATGKYFGSQMCVNILACFWGFLVFCSFVCLFFNLKLRITRLKGGEHEWMTSWLCGTFPYQTAQTMKLKLGSLKSQAWTLRYLELHLICIYMCQMTTCFFFQPLCHIYMDPFPIFNKNMSHPTTAMNYICYGLVSSDSAALRYTTKLVSKHWEFEQMECSGTDCLEFVFARNKQITHKEGSFSGSGRSSRRIGLDSVGTQLLSRRVVATRKSDGYSKMGGQNQPKAHARKRKKRCWHSSWNDVAEDRW